MNLGGTLALARAILAHAPGCLLLFASSADGYGESFRGGEALDEGARLAPLNPYAATKAAADLALGAMVPEGLRVVRARPFNHTGPGQAPAFAVPAFARQAARIKAGLQPPVMQVGNLEPRRDFLDVRDVCAAYALCLARGEALPPGVILNLASGQARRIGDVLADVLREAGVKARVETSAARLRPVRPARGAAATPGWHTACSAGHPRSPGPRPCTASSPTGARGSPKESDVRGVPPAATCCGPHDPMLGTRRRHRAGIL